PDARVAVGDEAVDQAATLPRAARLLERHVVDLPPPVPARRLVVEPDLAVRAAVARRRADLDQLRAAVAGAAERLCDHPRRPVPHLDVRGVAEVAVIVVELDQEALTLLE